MRAAAQVRRADRGAFHAVDLRADTQLVGVVVQPPQLGSFLLGVTGQAPLVIELTPQTRIQVGVFPGGLEDLEPSSTVRVWAHLDPTGTLVADRVVVTPQVVQGTLIAAHPLGSHGYWFLSVQTATETVGVVVPPSAHVRILPPWQAKDEWSGVGPLVAVGVVQPDGSLFAVDVVGLVPQEGT
jgi:hypothetical protein